MDAKNKEMNEEKEKSGKKTAKQLRCESKHLNEKNLLQNYSKEELVSFILTNREKLLIDEKKHRKNYIKKPKK